MPAPHSPDDKSRSFWMTQYLTNPATGETLLTLDDLDATFRRYPSIKEWLYVVHQEDDHNPDGRHVNVMIRFTNRGKARDVATLARWFGVPWKKMWPINGGDKGCAQVLAYFFHLDPAGAGKRTYGPDDAVAADGFDWQALMAGHPVDDSPREKLSPRGQILAGQVTAEQARRQFPLPDKAVRTARAEYLASLTPPVSRVGIYLQADAAASEPLAWALADRFGPCFEAPAWRSYETTPGIREHDDGETDRRKSSAYKTWGTYDGQPVVMMRVGTRDSSAPTVDDYADGLGGGVEFFRMLEEAPRAGVTGRLVDTAVGVTQPMNTVTILVGQQPWAEVQAELEDLYRRTVDNVDAATSAKLHIPMFITVDGDTLGLSVLGAYVQQSREAMQYMRVRNVRQTFTATIDQVENLPAPVQAEARTQLSVVQFAPVTEWEQGVRACSESRNGRYVENPAEDPQAALSAFMERAAATGIGQEVPADEPPRA